MPETLFGVFAGGPLHGVRMWVPNGRSAAMIIFAAPIGNAYDWLMADQTPAGPRDVWRRFTYSARNIAWPGIVWYDYDPPAKPITAVYERDSFRILPYAATPPRRAPTDDRTLAYLASLSDMREQLRLRGAELGGGAIHAE